MRTDRKYLGLALVAILLGSLSICRWKSSTRKDQLASPYPSEVRFVRETLSIEVSGNHVQVAGWYHFSHAAGREITLPIYYPFPAGRNEILPDSISVLHDGSQVFFKTNPSGTLPGFSCVLPLHAGEADSFYVYYRQPLSTSHFRYILTSTQSWGAPLEQAVWTVNLPASFEDIRCSYIPDSISAPEGQHRYVFTKHHITPDRDLEFWWR
ncbi:MAG: hypothetical protein V1800_12800 [Candidatus Latescibacterota bacterium]